jgi:hypothetical protein
MTATSAASFVVGATYIVRGEAMHGASFTCTKRTAKFVTMRSDNGTESRMMVRSATGTEVVLPYGSGRYAPRVTASNV